MLNKALFEIHIKRFAFKHTIEEAIVELGYDADSDARAELAQKLKAAIDGAGITFAGIEIAACDIAAERLGPIMPHQVPANAGYYLCYPPALERDRRIRNVRTWMLAEAAKTAQPLPSP